MEGMMDGLLRLALSQLHFSAVQRCCSRGQISHWERDHLRGNYLFTCAFTDDSKSFNFKSGNFGLLVTVLLIY